METGENRAYFDKHHLSGDVLVKKLVDSGWVEADRDALGGPARVWKHPNERGSVGLIAPYSKDFALPVIGYACPRKEDYIFVCSVTVDTISDPSCNMIQIKKT